MEYKKIVIAGGGILGSQIAFQSAYCGFDVTILIRKDDSKEEVQDKLKRLYETYNETIEKMSDKENKEINWAKGIAGDNFDKEDSLSRIKHALQSIIIETE